MAATVIAYRHAPGHAAGTSARVARSKSQADTGDALSICAAFAGFAEAGRLRRRCSPHVVARIKGALIR